MTGQQPPQVVTLGMDQLVAINVRYWRKAAGMTQEELGRRLGWSPANMSAAERSADSSRDRRRFDAQQLAELCVALGVPLSALFLPPPDDGDGKAYAFTAGGRPYGMGDLMEHVVMPDTTEDSALMGAYRDRFNGAALRAARGPRWMTLVARWVGGATRRDERAARLRDLAAGFTASASAAAAELEDLAAAIEDGKDGQ